MHARSMHGWLATAGRERGPRNNGPWFLAAHWRKALSALPVPTHALASHGRYRTVSICPAESTKPARMAGERLAQ